MLAEVDDTSAGNDSVAFQLGSTTVTLGRDGGGTASGVVAETGAGYRMVAELPLDGAAPSVIDRRGKPRSMAAIADLGARLRGFCLAHPEPGPIAALYRELAVEGAPALIQGPRLRYHAQIETQAGLRQLS